MNIVSIRPKNTRIATELDFKPRAKLYSPEFDRLGFVVVEKYSLESWACDGMGGEGGTVICEVEASKWLVEDECIEGAIALNRAADKL